MRLNSIPFNIWVLKISPELVRSMRPTTTGEIFETGTNNLNENGLFSVETYGPVGSVSRDQRFSYIDLHTQVFHPLIFKRLGTLKRMYLDICAGKRFAVWDDQIKDFVGSDPLNGETGYAFFVKHFPQIEFARSESSLRNLRIELIESNRDKAFTDKILVMPAGLRDIQVDNHGRTSEDDINGFYRSIIATANSISITETNRNDPVINTPRFAIQTQFQNIFDGVFQLIDGKGGLALAKWASRKVRNGTANVISPMIVTASRLREPGAPGINDLQMGLYQGVKSVLPQTRYQLKTGWLATVFGSGGENEVKLTNPKTLHAEAVSVSPEEVERYTTREGLDNLINRLRRKEYRQRPIRVEGYYLGLLYAGPEGWRIFADIRELPDRFDKKHVYPLNLLSLIYLSGYRIWHDHSGPATRYPVAGPDSTVYASMRLLTTTRSRILPELGDDWTRLGEDFVATAFPEQEPDATFVETMSPHTARLAGLTADFDGDRMTWSATYTQEAKDEFRRLKRRREWYQNADGRLSKTAAVDNINLLLKNITG